MKTNKRLKELTDEVIKKFPYEILEVIEVDIKKIESNYLLREDGFDFIDKFENGYHTCLPLLVKTKINEIYYYSSVGFYNATSSVAFAVRDKERNENQSYELLFPCDEFILEDAMTVFIEILERGDIGAVFLQSLKLRGIDKSLKLSKPIDLVFMTNPKKHDVPETKMTLSNGTEIEWSYVVMLTKKEYKKMKKEEVPYIF